MPSISDPQQLASLLGVAHEPITLAVGDPKSADSSVVREGAWKGADSSVVEEGAWKGVDSSVVEPGAWKGADSSVVEEGAWKGVDSSVVEEGALAPVSKPRKGRRAATRSGRALEPTDDSLDLGPHADPESVGRKILLDQLTGRARSRSELAKKMASKDVPDDVATRLLDRFEEVGLIDDAAFAQEWVNQRQGGKGLARRALAQELRRKGVDDEIARAALDTVETEDEVDAARLLVQRKLHSVRGLDHQIAIRRLVGMLARKGYSSGISFRVVREELNADLVDPEHSGL